jgi:hypothetical protein
MDTLVYSVGLYALGMIAASTIGIFNIGYNIISKKEESQNALVLSTYLIGLSYFSVIVGAIYTLHIPIVIILSVNSSNNMVYTLSQFSSPIIKGLLNLLEGTKNINILITEIINESDDESEKEEGGAEGEGGGVEEGEGGGVEGEGGAEGEGGGVEEGEGGLTIQEKDLPPSPKCSRVDCCKNTDIESIPAVCSSACLCPETVEETKDKTESVEKTEGEQKTEATEKID